MATTITSAGITFNDTTTLSSGNVIPKPASATAGQVLTYNASTTTWVASAAPQSISYGAGSTLAWVNFNGTGTIGTNQTIRAGYNVTSVYKNATGDFTIIYTLALPTSAYCVTGTTGMLINTRVGSIGVKDDTNTSTLSCRVQTAQHNATGGTDFNNNSVLITY